MAFVLRTPLLFGGGVRNPLELMLAVMERRWVEGDEKGAVEIAKLIAPYLHPRAGLKGVVDLAGVDDGELGTELG